MPSKCHIDGEAFELTFFSLAFLNAESKYVVFWDRLLDGFKGFVSRTIDLDILILKSGKLPIKKIHTLPYLGQFMRY